MSTTSTDASPITVTRITVPATLDAPDAGPFLAIARLGNAVCRHDTGHADLDIDAAEELPGWRDQTDRRLGGFWAGRDDEIVGVVTFMVPLDEGATNVEFDVIVDPDRWGEGVEEALLAAVESEARGIGRPVLQTWTLHRPDPGGERLQPPTGYGSIPGGDRQTVFQVENGFTLEQVERNSVFDLTSDGGDVDRMLAESQARAGDDYRVVSWTLPTPEDRKEGFAHAISRMSTDVPTGDLVWAEEVWDVDRVTRRDARLLDGGHTVSVACVEHVPTGTIAAYNELVIAEDHSGVTHQHGTLVLKEHRGRRLGMLVKCANIVRWRELMPESSRISTFNAEENRPMLDINEAIGFRPVSYAGAWKKTLA